MCWLSVPSSFCLLQACQLFIKASATLPGSDPILLSLQTSSKVVLVLPDLYFSLDVPCGRLIIRRGIVEEDDRK